MRIPTRAAFRLAFTGWLGLAGLLTSAAPGLAAGPPEKSLPDNTVLFAKVQNAATLREAFGQSQFGQLWADPALKDFRDDAAGRLEKVSTKMKETLGVNLREFLELPQGPISLAVVAREDAPVPFAVLLTADAGKNESTMTQVMTRATKRGEETGAKVAKEEFKGMTLYVIQPPKKDDDKPNDKDKDDDTPAPPIVWTHDGPLFYIGTDAAAVKDLIGNAQGRTDCLSSTENYNSSVKRLGSEAQALWFLDLNQALTLVAKAGAKGKNAANIEQFKGVAQLLGVNGLKAAAGTFNLNSGGFDSLSKTFVLAPAPVQGLLKIFAMPKVAMKPEPWVPDSVASYQSWSWDLDAAFVAINDLANMFQPGVLGALEQQLVGPNGGEPINFKKDIFDPLGDRISLISDYKKPVKEDSQRMLVAVALEDVQAFQSTLTKLINLAGGTPKKREFQGATIYDFDLPEIPNANQGNMQFKGPISVTIAKNTLFIATEPTLLEQVLRGGGASLADNSKYQAIAKEVPDKVSSLTYLRPDEQARVSYDMIKSGQFEKSLQTAAAAGGPDLGKIGKLFDKDKLPDFSVFAKYLSQGGGFGVMDDDGMMFQSFTLRKSNP